MQLVPSQPEQADYFIETVDALCEQLCPDCPLRNAIATVTMDRMFIDEAAPPEDRMRLAIREGELLGTLSMAATVRSNVECEGKEDIDCCPDCGSTSDCGALVSMEAFVETRDHHEED